MMSRDDKPRGIDFEEMEAALKRAAYKAVHGTREERSGRFRPDRPSNPKAAALAERTRNVKGGGKSEGSK